MRSQNKSLGLGNLLKAAAERRTVERTKATARAEVEKLRKELVEASRTRTISEETLLTSKQIAPLVGVQHHKTVERWAREGILPCVRRGRNLRFRLGDVRRWVAQRKEG